MNCIIVDDNRLERKVVMELLIKLDYVTVIGEMDNPIAAINLIKTGVVNLVLLDVEMPEMSGLEFLRIEDSPLVILMSGKRDYAFEAFEYNVVDYLLKPINAERFIKAINRARELYDSQHKAIDLNETDFIYIKEKGVITRIKVDEITFIQAMGDYITINTYAKRFTLRTPLKVVDEKLPPNKFCRVHRSFIVAVDKVETIEENTISIDKNLIPLSEMYKGNFLQRLNLI